MEDNNQNNEIIDTSMIQNEILSESTNQINGSNINKATNVPKKNGPLVAFGVVLLVAIVLVVTLFVENKSDISDNGNVLINENMPNLI